MNKRRCTVDGQNAVFHMWAERAEVVAASVMVGGTPAGQIKWVTAIVEFDDGTVKEVLPNRVKFLSEED